MEVQTLLSDLCAIAASVEASRKGRNNYLYRL